MLPRAPVDPDDHVTTNAPRDDPTADALARIEAELRSFNRRSAHRETVIDHLHEENQQLRQGLRRGILEPVVADLIHLYDGLTRQAERLPDDRLFASFADDVALALERCGMEIYPTVAGDRYEPTRHAVAGTVPTSDPALGGTVAEVLAVGVAEAGSGRVRRPARVRMHKLTTEAIDPPTDG